MTFEARKKRALEKIKKPVEDDSVIHLPDLSAATPENKDAPAEEKVDANAQFFSVLPGEVPEAPDGGDFVLDSSADTSQLGVFTYAGHILRPVTPTEYDYLNTVTANTKLRKEKGPKRLSTLGTAEPKKDTEPKPNADSGNNEPTVEELLAKLAAKNKKAKEGADRQSNWQDEFLKHCDPDGFYVAESHSDNWKGGDAQGTEHVYGHSGVNGIRFSQAQVDWVRGGRNGPQPLAGGGVGGNGGGGETPPGEPRPERRPTGGIIIPIEAPIVSWRTVDPRRYNGLVIKNTRAVLANEKEAQLFGELLHAVDSSKIGVIERYKNGNASTEDMDFITYATKEFSYAMKMAEDTITHLGPADYAAILRHNSDMENVFVQEGTERAQQIVKNCILHMAMRRPHDVYAIQVGLRQMHKDIASRTYQKFNTEANALASEAGIPLSEYDRIFQMDRGQREGTRANLNTHLRSQMGGVEKGLDTIASWFGKSRADRMMSRADVLARQVHRGPVQRIHQNLTAISGALGEVVGSAEIRNQVTREVIENKDLPTIGDGGPRSFEQVQALSKDKYSAKSLETRLKERIDADPDWKTGGEERQTEKLREWKREEAQEQQGRGFWAMLFAIAFGRSFDQAASSAAGRPVHV